MSTIEIRERTLREKLMWYAAFFEDAKSRDELVAAAIQIAPLLRQAADALPDDGSTPEADTEPTDA